MAGKLTDDERGIENRAVTPSWATAPPAWGVPSRDVGPDDEAPGRPYREQRKDLWFQPAPDSGVDDHLTRKPLYGRNAPSRLSNPPLSGPPLIQAEPMYPPPPANDGATKSSGARKPDEPAHVRSNEKGTDDRGISHRGLRGTTRSVPFAGPTDPARRFARSSAGRTPPPSRPTSANSKSTRALKSVVKKTDQDRFRTALETLFAANELTGFDLLSPAVQQAILRGEATWPDGSLVTRENYSKGGTETVKRKPLYRELLKPGEREPTIEEQAQLGGLLRAFLTLIATDPTAADRIVEETLFFRYPDNELERARAAEAFWATLFDPLLWLSFVDPAALVGPLGETLDVARASTQSARSAASLPEAKNLLGKAATLAQAGRLEEAVVLARQAQELSAMDASRFSESTGVTRLDIQSRSTASDITSTTRSDITSTSHGPDLQANAKRVGEHVGEIHPATGHEIIAEVTEESNKLDVGVEAAKPSQKAKLTTRFLENPGTHDPSRRTPNDPRVRYDRAKGVMPSNQGELFERSIEFQGKRYALDAEGNIHQFQPTKKNIFHWAGAEGSYTADGASRDLELPSGVRSLIRAQLQSR